MTSCGLHCRRRLDASDPDCGQCGALRGDNPPMVIPSDIDENGVFIDSSIKVYDAQFRFIGLVDTSITTIRSAR